jgi:hypothetical protein
MSRLPSTHRSERGSALIITLVVILAMTGLGAIAFNTAVTSTLTANHFALQKRASYAAEVALLTGVEYLNWNLNAVVDYAEGSGAYEFHESDSIRNDITVGGYFSANPFGKARLQPFFRVRYSDIAPARRAAEFDEGFCYMRLQMSGAAGIRDPERDVADANVSEIELSGGLISREFTGHFYVGPVRCPGYEG